MSSYTADRAVDGNTGNLFFEDNSCSHTADGKNEAWWQVNLLQLSNIKKVSIFYRRNYTERFWGFHLFVSNTSDWSSGYLCYNHKGPDLPDEIQNVSCPTIGQFVTIATFRNKTSPAERRLESTAYLELCEVQVYGCPYGRYGKDCSKYCSEDCRQVNCDADSGKCIPRCEDGLKGVKCKEYCDYGSFGSGCRGRCYCMQGTCDPVSGICPTGGCQGGWNGKSCNKACASFTYGPDCKFTCHCKNSTCDRFTGKCLYGCEEGWVGPNCNQECMKISNDHPRKAVITCLIIVAVSLLVINILSCAIYYRKKMSDCRGGRVSYNVHVSNPAYDINEKSEDITGIHG